MVVVGHFSVVRKAELKTTSGAIHAVAAKLPKQNLTFSKNMEAVIMEAETLSQFNHRNILPLLGYVLDNEMFFILTPYMSNGDLRNFIKKNHLVGIKL